MDEKLCKKLRLDKFKDIAYIGKSKEESPFNSMEYAENLRESTDLAIFYVYSLEEMKKAIDFMNEQSFEEGGIIYLCYPKMKNTLEHDGISRDDIFPYLDVDDETGFIKDSNFKFNKMVAVDENYTLVAVKKDEKRRHAKSSAPSGRVADYIQYIPAIESHLQDTTDLLEKFNALTDGKKREWARHIYSARTEPTRVKRYRELEKKLKELS